MKTITLTPEQKLEIEKCYTFVTSKDKELKSLGSSLLQTLLESLQLTNVRISYQSYWVEYWPSNKRRIDEANIWVTFKQLSPTIVCYILTKNKKYLGKLSVDKDYLFSPNRRYDLTSLCEIVPVSIK